MHPVYYDADIAPSDLSQPAEQVAEHPDAAGAQAELYRVGSVVGDRRSHPASALFPTQVRGVETESG